MNSYVMEGAFLGRCRCLESSIEVGLENWSDVGMPIFLGFGCPSDTP
jgi:hypothetical protein